MPQRVTFFALTIAISLAYAGQDDARCGRSPDPAWVDSTLSRLTLQEKIGQMIQSRVYGDYANPNDPSFRAAQSEIEMYHVGSVVLGGRMAGPNLSKGTPRQVANILNAFQRGSKLPLLVASDLERGLASRLAGTPEFPFPMAFGAAGDYALSERAAKFQAEQARAVGINWTLAPTADVNSNPENPIINTRSFGEDPEQVAMFVKAYIAGAHGGKVLVTAKHFPGHGDASADSHVGIVSIDADMAHLNSIELPPFIAAIAAGVDAIMPAHAAVPALDAEPGKIATTSFKINTKLLKEKLRFHGLIVTDALEMRGLTGIYSGVANPTGQAAVDAIKAGADVVMVPQNLPEAFEAIVKAVKTGEISETRIDESVLKILTAKETLGLDKVRTVDETKIDGVFSTLEAKRLAQDVSDESVTLVRNHGNVLPIPGGAQHRGLVVITSTDSMYSPLGKQLEAEMRTRRPDVQVFRIYNDGVGSADPADVLSAVASAERVVIAAYVTHVPGRQVVSGGKVVVPVGLMGASAKLLEDVIRTKPKETVVVALGSPYLIEGFPTIENYVCTYSLASTAEVTAVRALFGEIQNHARLPVTIQGVARRGESIPWPKASPSS